MADNYLNLGNSFLKQTKLGDAIEYYQLALQRNPRSAETFYNLGRALSLQGRMNEAEEHYRYALRLEPDNLVIYQAILMAMNYNPRYDAQTIFSEHFRLGKMLTEPLRSSILPFNNDRSSFRRLKIGYVSPDFKIHSVAYFIEPVLASHDHNNFEIFCYSDVSAEDETTIRIQGYTDHWITIFNKTDEEVAQLIRNDKIDILVDLAGHTGQRMLLFANKPAPIQVNWIGYPATTGLSTMDYKIVDDYTDPPGLSEGFYSERLMRLPQIFLCYSPEKESPDIGKLPACEKGYITFGSFNNLPKISSEMFSLWSKVLRSIPNSHLIMKAGSLIDHKTRLRVSDIFKQEGIESTRIEMMSWIPSKREHLNVYNYVDIALDTFPYNGTTTLCEALWMGVPVITLAGKAHVSRVGLSILTNAGLRELVADTQNEYVENTVKLANDIEKLKFLRERLRDMMIQSPLTDAKRCTSHVERCYRTMWETWCNR